MAIQSVLENGYQTNGPRSAIAREMITSGTTGTFGEVAISDANNVMSNSPNGQIKLIASAPVQYPGSRSNFRLQVGQCSLI